MFLPMLGWEIFLPITHYRDGSTYKNDVIDNTVHCAPWSWQNILSVLVTMSIGDELADLVVVYSSTMIRTASLTQSSHYFLAPLQCLWLLLPQSLPTYFLVLIAVMFLYVASIPLWLIVFHSHWYQKTYQFKNPMKVLPSNEKATEKYLILHLARHCHFILSLCLLVVSLPPCTRQLASQVCLQKWHNVYSGLWFHAEYDLHASTRKLDNAGISLYLFQ